MARRAIGEGVDRVMRDDEGIDPEADAAVYWIITWGLALIVIVAVVAIVR